MINDCYTMHMNLGSGPFHEAGMSLVSPQELGLAAAGPTCEIAMHCGGDTHIHVCMLEPVHDGCCRYIVTAYSTLKRLVRRWTSHQNDPDIELLNLGVLNMWSGMPVNGSHSLSCYSIRHACCAHANMSVRQAMAVGTVSEV